MYSVNKIDALISLTRLSFFCYFVTSHFLSATKVIADHACRLKDVHASEISAQNRIKIATSSK